MKDSLKEKYLGDLVTSSGKIKATIDDRAAKGVGIVSEILALLEEIPLGSYKLDMGLKLRQAKFINGILFSSEAWHGISNDDVKVLEKIDESLIRALLQAHAKVPIEFLYLETGSIRIRHILSSRRLMYFQTLLMRDDEEVTKRVLREQQCHPCPGDFVMLIKDDCEKLNMLYDENCIITAGRGYKKHIKKSVRHAAFNELLNEQKEHSKVKDIKYEKFDVQPYLKSSMFTNEDVSLLAALRSHTVRGIRCNFKNCYKPNIFCPLKCWPTGSPPIEDTQEHLLVCTQLKIVHTNTVANTKINYCDIYGELVKQKAVVSLFKQLIGLRNTLLENES